MLQYPAGYRQIIGSIKKDYPVAGVIALFKLNLLKKLASPAIRTIYINNKISLFYSCDSYKSYGIYKK